MTTNANNNFFINFYKNMGKTLLSVFIVFIMLLISLLTYSAPLIDGEEVKSTDTVKEITKSNEQIVTEEKTVPVSEEAQSAVGEKNTTLVEEAKPPVREKNITPVEKVQSAEGKGEATNNIMQETVSKTSGGGFWTGVILAIVILIVILTTLKIINKIKISNLFSMAEQGDATAQYNLGKRYENGEGVEKDGIESVKWFRKAAVQGHADAQKNLGDFYYNGKGVVKDKDEAVKWFRKAAEQGNADAQKNLDNL
jgi:TPR repeat protein